MAGHPPGSELVRGSVATTQATKDLDQDLPPHMHTHMPFFTRLTDPSLALAGGFSQSSCHDEVPKDSPTLVTCHHRVGGNWRVLLLTSCLSLMSVCEMQFPKACELVCIFVAAAAAAHLALILKPSLAKFQVLSQHGGASQINKLKTVFDITFFLKAKQHTLSACY